jgi:peptidoglycan hydrolase-like protein with peptidoglycan-binding domain
MRNFAAVDRFENPMGLGRPRSIAGALLVLALAVSLTQPALAPAKKRHPRVFAFGTRTLQPGTSGKDVRYLQRALSRLGVATSVDGAFGKGTMRSVKTLERQRGWPVNGVVSKKDARKIKKLLARGRVSGGYFVYGYVSPSITLTARRAGHATVAATDLAGRVVQTIPVNFDAAGTQAVAWNGGTPGAYAPDGTYQLTLTDAGTAKAAVSGGQTEPFGMHLHQFPVPGPHTYGGPDSRFGAPRSGHVHQGQDLPAACGERLYVFETGQVKVNAYQASGAGYYVVIHGLLTGTDAVYMHLSVASWAPAGTNVFAGQQIGKVGATGDAVGCHLHFERWSAPGWYVGGAPYDPLPELQYWDTYS